MIRPGTSRNVPKRPEAYLPAASCGACGPAFFAQVARTDLPRVARTTLPRVARTFLSGIAPSLCLDTDHIVPQLTDGESSSEASVAAIDRTAVSSSSVIVSWGRP